MAQSKPNRSRKPKPESKPETTAANEEAKTDAAETTEKQQRTHVTNRDFVMAWQAADSSVECAASLGVALSTVRTRARRLRKMGVNLKTMKNGRGARPVDVDDLNALIGELEVDVETDAEEGES